MPRTAADLGIDETAEISAVNSAGGMTIRLLEMGLVPGVVITMVKRAPTGDPLQLQLRGFHLSLRRAEAQLIELEEARK